MSTTTGCTLNATSRSNNVRRIRIVRNNRQTCRAPWRVVGFCVGTVYRGLGRTLGPDHPNNTTFRCAAKANRAFDTKYAFCVGSYMCTSWEEAGMTISQHLSTCIELGVQVEKLRECPDETKKRPCRWTSNDSMLYIRVITIHIHAQ